MAYTEKHKTDKVNAICEDISEGMSLRKACERHDVHPKTFYQWIQKDIEKGKQYVYATEQRAEIIFEDIINIADGNKSDIIITGESHEITNHDAINRSRLMVDARKWMLGKMNPKKYGDKIHNEHSGEIATKINFVKKKDGSKR